MAVTDEAISKRKRFFLLTGLVLGVYPLLTTLILQFGWWIIDRLWTIGKHHVVDLGYRTMTESFYVTWASLLVYDVGIYLAFIHLPFLGIIRWYRLEKNKWACFAVYLVLFLVVDLVIFPEPTMSSYFGRGRVGESYTLVIIVATCMFPFYYRIVKRPVG